MTIPAQVIQLLRQYHSERPQHVGGGRKVTSLTEICGTCRGTSGTRRTGPDGPVFSLDFSSPTLTLYLNVMKPDSASNHKHAVTPPYADSSLSFDCPQCSLFPFCPWGCDGLSLAWDCQLWIVTAVVVLGPLLYAQKRCL